MPDKNHDNPVCELCHVCKAEAPRSKVKAKGWFTLRCEGCDSEWTFCAKCAPTAIQMRWCGSECIYCPEDGEKG